jgi:hypothetical protein
VPIIPFLKDTQEAFFFFLGTFGNAAAAAAAFSKKF